MDNKDCSNITITLSDDGDRYSVRAVGFNKKGLISISGARETIPEALHSIGLSIEEQLESEGVDIRKNEAKEDAVCITLEVRNY